MIVTDKDKNIINKFLLLEDQEQAFKKILIEALALASIDITPAKIDTVFDMIEEIVSEEEEEDSK